MSMLFYDLSSTSGCTTLGVLRVPLLVHKKSFSDVLFWKGPHTVVRRRNMVELIRHPMFPV